MVRQNGKWYWDFDGIHTRVPAMMDSKKLLIHAGIYTNPEQLIGLDQEFLTKEVRDKINNGNRYMEVPSWLMFGRI